MKVKILIGIWADSIGILQDRIPHTEYFNVWINREIGRLALKESEFEVL